MSICRPVDVITSVGTSFSTILKIGIFIRGKTVLILIIRFFGKIKESEIDRHNLCIK